MLNHSPVKWVILVLGWILWLTICSVWIILNLQTPTSWTLLDLQIINSLMALLTIVFFILKVLISITNLDLVNGYLKKTPERVEIHELSGVENGFSIHRACRVVKTPNHLQVVPNTIATWTSSIVSWFFAAFLLIIGGATIRVLIFYGEYPVINEWEDLLQPLIIETAFIILMVITLVIQGFGYRSAGNTISIDVATKSIRHTRKHRKSQFPGKRTKLVFPWTVLSLVKIHRVQKDPLIKTYGIHFPLNQVGGEIEVIDALRKARECVDGYYPIIVSLNLEWNEQLLETMTEFVSLYSPSIVIS